MTSYDEVLSDLRAENEYLSENLNDMARRYESLDWVLMDGYEENGGISLDKLKSLSRILRDMAATNPLIKSGVELRTGYVFGEGVNFTGLEPRAQSAIDDPDNFRSVFSLMGCHELNMARYTDGNVFLLFDKRTKKFTRIPMEEVSAYTTDPDSNERLWAVKRTWTTNGATKQQWFPVSTAPASAPKSIKGSQVSTNKVIIHWAVNRQAGWSLGVPDSLAAMSWAIAYSHYLNNNSRLVKAYAQFAFKVTNPSKKGAANAAVEVARGGGNVGGTASMGNGNELSPVGATGSQVDFNNGQPLAAMVAASLGVSVLALLSSPGASGGSYASAAALDVPTVKRMQVLKDSWVNFFQHVLTLLKSKTGVVSMPDIETDPAYRQISSLTTAYFSGALHQSEYREAALTVLGVTPLKKAMPKPDKFNNGGDAESGGKKDPVSSQGVSGIAGGTNQGDTNNDSRKDTVNTGE